ncbi:MBL fold metallo-hydrolase [Kitasatospora sp. NBC_01539]|uniref:MBL fold metallo-hydrolase n=1 Tax=Kitasatospora sp. NBC_01539 TaxID=2903577 RepID=UPI0038600AE9
MTTNPLARRTLLRTAAAGAAALPAAALPAHAAATAPAADPARTGTATAFTWLGNSGWRIEGSGRTVLLDPYLTRYDTGLFPTTSRKPAFDPATELTVDTALVEQHAGRADLILVTHAHWDHVNDVPHIARTTGATVMGTQTTCHLLAAMGVDRAKLVPVKGGEVLDFDGFTVETVGSLHSRNAKHTYFAPGTLTAPPARAPLTIGDLPEGDTLAFQIRFGDGPSAFLTGASDFVERHVTGLRPDIAMVAVPSRTGTTHAYASRLLNALGRPRTVVPVHWDNFETPIGEPALADDSMDLDGVVAEARRLVPGGRVIVPEHLQTLQFGG